MQWQMRAVSMYTISRNVIILTGQEIMLILFLEENRIIGFMEAMVETLSIVGKETT